jgi:hypothetical protein
MPFVGDAVIGGDIAPWRAIGGLAEGELLSSNTLYCSGIMLPLLV